MRKMIVATCLLLGVSAVALSSSLDAFLTRYQQGNLHTALQTDVVEIIRLFGREPESYEHYSSDAKSFTYADRTVDHGVAALTFIWTDTNNKVAQIRALFSGTFTPAEVGGLLGYSPTPFQALTSGSSWLGNTPYHILTCTIERVLPVGSSKTVFYDAYFQFFLNHFDDSVYMMILALR